MEPSPPAQPDSPPAPPSPSPAAAPATVIIVGFGRPGRFVAEILDARKVPYCVIELNPTNARSIAACKKSVVCGDARDPALLKQAGIDAADLLAVTLPDERIVLE